jgi:hypothetical protein
MKFIKVEQVEGHDGLESRYIFSFQKKELITVYDCLTEIYKKIPRLFEFSPTRHRISSILNVFHKVLSEDKSVDNFKDDIPPRRVFYGTKLK